MDMTGLPHGKPAPQRTKRSRQTALDRNQNVIVKVRSGLRCEVRVQVMTDARTVWCAVRCGQRASEVHHMIGGRGKRGIGPSALAIHKQHVCASHHRYITGDVGGKRLVLVQAGPLPVYTDPYRRVK